ncbi:ABC transporter ATP-binding protein [Spiroplasma sabaudiense Ar-1343]|uniref:ABC transporter ATP-binding protein n=1 Tax=Spiroplasma sabaudiense Ar-1343 TaxID=1276257 RepID=W6AAS1_9MOLU|nr:ABC transporter ATP-binding protein [Spiroplasma sabaudiense]AHI54111.1 ABC transporter ATP-binding protein [Spiroplasma sabaudiense Ar-1343]
MSEVIISFQNYVKNFKKFKVGPINFNIHRGEFHAVLGSSGSGKSVILNTIIGSIYKYQGKVTFEGKNRRSNWKQNANLGYYQPTDFSLVNDSLWKYLITVAKISGIRSKKYRLNRVRYLIKLFELWEHRTKSIRSFSFGMKNRVSLIIALLKNPDVIVLDEPGANLDTIWRKKIYAIFERLKEEGKTLILTTHNIDEFYSLFDALTVVEEGRLIYSGKIKDVNMDLKYRVVVAGGDSRSISEFLRSKDISCVEDETTPNGLIVLFNRQFEVNYLFLYLVRNNLPLDVFEKVVINMEEIIESV